YGCERVKSMGNIYLFECGISTPCDDHHFRIAQLALDLLGCIESHQIDGVRIGISCGPVLASVFGSVRFSYDVIGAPVNIAFKMINSSELNKIQVTERFCNLIDSKFNLEQRVVHEQTTYYLNNQK